MSGTDASALLLAGSKLGSRYLTEYVRGLERCASLVGALAKPGNNSATLGHIAERYLGFVTHELPAVATELAEASLTYYGTVLSAAVAASNKFFDELAHDASSTIRTQAPVKDITAPSGPRVATNADVQVHAATPPRAAAASLFFRGRTGERSGNAFRVANTQAESIAVAFAVDAFVSEDGTRQVSTEAVFAPPQCELAPGAEQVVQCTVTLAAEFLPGVTYRSHINVVGFPGMSMPIALEVEVTATANAAKTPTKRKRTPRKIAGS